VQILSTNSIPHIKPSLQQINYKELNNVDVSTLNEERKNFMELNLDGGDKDAVEDKLKDHVQLSSKHNANTSMYLFIKDHKCSDKNTVKLTDLNNTLSTI
jgi:hypothetical protein